MYGRSGNKRGGDDDRRREDHSRRKDSGNKRGGDDDRRREDHSRRKEDYERRDQHDRGLEDRIRQHNGRSNKAVPFPSMTGTKPFEQRAEEEDRYRKRARPTNYESRENEGRAYADNNYNRTEGRSANERNTHERNPDNYRTEGRSTKERKTCDRTDSRSPNKNERKDHRTNNSRNKKSADERRRDESAPRDRRSWEERYGDGAQPRGAEAQARGAGAEARGEGRQARGEIPQARGQVPQARGQVPQARGQVPQARGGATAQVPFNPKKKAAEQKFLRWCKKKIYGRTISPTEFMFLVEFRFQAMLKEIAAGEAEPIEVITLDDDDEPMIVYQAVQHDDEPMIVYQAVQQVHPLLTMELLNRIMAWRSGGNGVTA